jgi:epoxide hydrolase
MYRIESPRSYRIRVPDEVIDDLKERLAMTRWPDEIPEAPWRYGTVCPISKN